jgi:hypothetical protein
MAQMAAYMSPEATENFKNSMRVGEIMASSFKRMFPNWDRMTEEQKRSIMNDPEIAGKIEAQRRFAEAEKVKKRTQADTEETSRLKSKYKVMGGMSATGIV